MNQRPPSPRTSTGCWRIAPSVRALTAFSTPPASGWRGIASVPYAARKWVARHRQWIHAGAAILTAIALTGVAFHFRTQAALQATADAGWEK